MRDSEAEQNLEPSLLMTIVLSSHKGDPFSIFLFRDFLAGRTLRSSVLWNSKIWRHHSRFLMTKLMGIASTVNLPPGTAQDCQEQGRQCSEAHTDRIRPACACKLHHPVCTRLSISTGEESLWFEAAGRREEWHRKCRAEDCRSGSWGGSCAKLRECCQRVIKWRGGGRKFAVSRVTVPGHNDEAQRQRSQLEALNKRLSQEQRAFEDHPEKYRILIWFSCSELLLSLQ